VVLDPVNFTAGLAFSRLRSRLSRDFRGGGGLAKSRRLSRRLRGLWFHMIGVHDKLGVVEFGLDSSDVTAIARTKSSWYLLSCFVFIVVCMLSHILVTVGLLILECL